MSELKKQEQVAIEAVARHFSATWEKGENPPGRKRQHLGHKRDDTVHFATTWLAVRRLLRSEIDAKVSVVPPVRSE